MFEIVFFFFPSSEFLPSKDAQTNSPQLEICSASLTRVAHLNNALNPEHDEILLVKYLTTPV